MKKFLFILSLTVCMNAWAADCDKAISDCVSRYREELSGNKRAIQDYQNHNSKTDIGSYLYKGDKVCSEEMFDVGGECQGTKLRDNEYSEWQQKIARTHANDLISMMKQKAEREISNAFDLSKKYVNEIKNELMEKVMQKSLSKSEANKQIKETIIPMLKKTETYKTEIYWDVTNSLYGDFNGRRFDESKLQCFEPKCFELIISNKLKSLESEKSHFLNNTKNILEYIKN
ncbi:MAG: hypothetical protein sL5_03160 [Candidatus Mesenet longicola]|uniref:DUF1311 domain-containing protein n=1 Tax=Candidatus Mesenet longicola TaxID=1892558 RepID=A0A8J3HPK8_9RICK|nr:MAG: hypothetical protein sGL2_03370 [Candidatus Mesenet longicola]GHM59323.1 MAG: hypothetical protein sL5_03160 [Candidatus Mesenet longicola]